MKTLNIKVGMDLRETRAEVGNAWKAAGERPASTPASRSLSPKHQLQFTDWAAFRAVLTPKRIDLIRHLHRQPAPSIRALAKTLGRDVGVSSAMSRRYRNSAWSRGTARTVHSWPYTTKRA